VCSGSLPVHGSTAEGTPDQHFNKPSLHLHALPTLPCLRFRSCQSPDAEAIGAVQAQVACQFQQLSAMQSGFCPLTSATHLSICKGPQESFYLCIQLHKIRVIAAAQACTNRVSIIGYITVLVAGCQLMPLQSQSATDILNSSDRLLPGYSHQTQDVL